MKFTEIYFFRRYGFDPSLKTSLSEEAGLGAHSNVVVVSKDNAGHWTERRYVWSHIGSRPWGTDVLQQCPGCKRLRPWGKPKISKETTKSAGGELVVKHTIKHACRSCRFSRLFDKSSGLVHDGAMGECGRGEWYFTRRVLSNNVA
jgi:hypothetical protein